ncbi:MAG: cytochrome bc complex cytochrome b subunit [Thermoplasmataceae archaeon]
MTDKEQNEIIKIMNDPQPIPRKVPDYMRTKGGMWYWTGAMVMFAFLYEVITGLVILFYYQPSSAYATTESLLNSTPFGMIILTTHLYGAYAMIALLYLHLLRNLFVGAYKKPRQNQWITGILLLLLSLGTGFFGYSMSGDILSINATGVGRGIANALPLIGSYLGNIFFGNGTMVSLFQRMLGWHIVLAALIGITFGAHFFLAEYNTIMPKRSESKYRAPLVDRETSGYKPWYPYNMLFMIQIAFYTFAAILIIPSVIAALPNVPTLLSPFPQVQAGTPFSGPLYPPWFLLFVYKAMDFQISSTIDPFWATVVFAIIPLIYLLILPYIDRNNSLSMLERPVVVSLGAVGIAYLIGLSLWGALTPGLPIPNSEVLMFFILVGVAVFLIVWLAIWSIRNNKTRLKEPSKVYVLLGLTGIFAFGTGSLLIPSITSLNPALDISIIILAMATAFLILLDYVYIRPREPQVTPIEKSTKMKPITYNLIAAFLVFCAIVILFIITPLNPSVIGQEAGYGFGIGILLFISGTLVKIYRTVEYKE